MDSREHPGWHAEDGCLMVASSTTALAVPTKGECYKLDCFGCGETVEIACSSVVDGTGSCVHCAAQLQVDWGGGARDYDAWKAAKAVSVPGATA
jgi:hypothetical protein